MSKEEYIKSIIKLLDCDKKEKRRIASDLENDISSALQHGESMSEIMDRMGSPEEIAEDFMYNIHENSDRKQGHSKGIFYIVSACCIFLAGFLMNLLLMRIVSGTPGISFQESMYCMACWLVLLIVLIVIEILTLGLTTIWFAGGSLIALVLAVLGCTPTAQVISFCVVTAVLLFLTRPVAVKYFNKTRVKTNVESLIGKNAVVTVDIDNVEGSGEAVVDGVIWTARASDDDDHIVKGERVEIVRISGAKLIVRRSRRRF